MEGKKYTIYDEPKAKDESESRNENPGEVLKGTCKVFAENTTAHGFAHIVATTSRVLKYVWVLIMLACTVALVFQIYPMVERYLERPIATRITMVRKSHPQFPVVIVCNVNKLKLSLRHNLSREVDFDTGLYEQTEGSYGTSDDSFSFDSLENVSHNILEKYGNQLNETVTECVWKNSERCTGERYWQTYWNYKYGNCFVFNSGFDDYGQATEVRTTSHTGVNSGLSVTVNIQPYEYDASQNSSGIRIFVGDQGQLYSPINHGLSLSTGFAYLIPLRKKVVHRADPFQNGSCVKHATTRYAHDTFGQRIITKYTQEFCYKQCLTTVMYEKCRCLDYWLPKPVGMESNVVCGKENATTTTKCAVDVMRRWLWGDLPCISTCNPPCEETQYAMPRTSMERFHGNFKTVNGLDTVKLSLYFEDLEYDLVQDYRSYLTANLFGDIGGLLGLFNGYSILTVFEILFFLGQLAMLLCAYICHSENENIDENQPTP